MSDPAADAARARLPDRPDAFVSYSRRDKDFVVGRLLPALAERGKEVWLDVEDIPPAADWRATMLDGVGKSAAFVFVISPDSLRSPVCAEELERALELNKRLVPVVCRAVDATEARPELQRANWVLLRGEDDFDAGFGKLVDALETDLEWREMHTRVTVRALEWAHESRDRSFLLRGSDLKRAEAWLARQGAHAESATPEQTDYILRSRAAATRRQRITLAAVVAALVVAVVLAIVALAQRQEARRQARVATSRELAATSLALIGRDPELSVLLARQSSEKSATEEAEDALRQSLLRWPERRLVGGRAAVRSAEYGPDGRLVLIAGSPARVYDAASGRMLRRLPAPGGEVVSAHFDPGGRRVIVATAGGAVVADARTGRVSARLPASGPPLRGARFDGGGRRVITVTATGARVYDARSGRALATLDAPLTADALLAGNGDLAVTYGPTDTARVWRVSGARLVAELRHAQPLLSATASPNGRLLATTTLKGRVTLWRLPDGRPTTRLEHLTAVSGVSFSRDGRRLLTASSFGKVWDVRTRRTVRELRQASQVLAGAFSRDGRRVATGDIDGVARVWDVASGRLVQRLSGHRGPIETVGFSPDGRFVLTGGRDRTARFWEAAPGSSALRLRRGGEAVRDASFSPDGRVVATASDHGVVRLWDAATGAHVADLPGPGGAVRTLAFSDERSALIAGAESGRARTYRLRDRRPLATLRGHRGAIEDVALSPGADYAAAVGKDSTVRVWDARHGRPLARLGPFGDIGGTTIRFALGGRRIVAQIGDAVGLAEAPSGRQITAFPTAAAVEVSPDGRTLAVGALSNVALRRATDGRQSASFASRDGISSVSFGPDGRYLAGVGSSGTGNVWRLRSRTRVFRLRQPSVFALAVAPGNRFVAAGRDDGLVSVFELGSEQRVATFGAAGRGRASSVEFGRDERSLLVRERDGDAWIYPCDLCRSRAELERLALERAPRELTPQERRQYLHEGEE